MKPDQEQELFARIRARLVHARGSALAVTLPELARELGARRRNVEIIINRRRADFPFLLVSGGAGLFVPTADAELNRFLHSLHSRHREMQRTEAIARRKALATGWRFEDGRFIAPAQAHQQELF